MSDLPGFHDLTAWQIERLELRRRLWALLGDLPPLFTPTPVFDLAAQHPGFTLHHFSFDNEAGAMVYGYLLIPDDLRHPAPAVLYHHVHGGKYDWGKEQLLTPHLTHGRADGVELARRGFIVLGIDAYCFGERTSQGPAGARETGRETEHALAKQFLWQGKSLWGMMVRDDLLALNILLARPEVDPSRVAVTGMSLGGSRTTWLSALDDRVALTIPVSQMTRYADLLADGQLNRHSIYYYVPGMLQAGIDMEQIVALTAPRAQVILSGDSDPSSPLRGITTIIQTAQQVYRLYGAADRLQVKIYPGIEHAYTSAMHDDMVAAVQAWLGPDAR
ncbi:MAG: dienelactone hydrolase family protein [Anaerolineae bacterium]|nr:dienelactone hydrolase family protein [Anaerolineae bacterium]NUQ03439.1 acetylxylan esterase [Anaerolineae bacterium]